VRGQYGDGKGLATRMSSWQGYETFLLPPRADSRTRSTADEVDRLRWGEGAVKLVGARSCIALPNTLSRRGAYLDTVSWNEVCFAFGPTALCHILHKTLSTVHCTAQRSGTNKQFEELTVFKLCSQNASSLDFSSSSTCMFCNTQHSPLLICHKTVNSAYTIIATKLKFIYVD
jgi:hypothetical protein